ncbi:MAG TPA: hypothetical protein VNH44_10735 [Micropepsaceae bacterium]|nr:hypothetical protein [Micropepsaceae bacterium]
MAKSTKSTKLRTEEQTDAEEAEQTVASVARSVPSIGVRVPEDWAADILRAVLKWQIEQIRMEPAKDEETVALRARDSRTMKEMVHTMEKLDAVEKRRDSKGRKSKSRDDRALKEEFVRRLDQLLAARIAGSIPGEPKGG